MSDDDVPGVPAHSIFVAVPDVDVTTRAPSTAVLELERPANRTDAAA